MSDEQLVPQAAMSEWAVVELLGHRKEIGFVTTQAFGPAVLFRVDTPDLPEREYVLESPEYINNRMCPTGTKVKRAASPAKSCLVAPASLYAINPCSEQAAMALIERNVHRPLIVLEMPEQPALNAHVPSEIDDDFEDDDEMNRDIRDIL